MTLPTIETSRMILTTISAEDMTRIFETLSKPEIMVILGHQSDEAFEKELWKHENGFSSYNRSFVLFLLTDKATGTIFGRCGLHNWNQQHRRAEIGYNIDDEAFKRKGLMSEAIAPIIDYGFEKLNLNRIEALVGKDNVPSLRLMEKYNFNREGVMKQHYNVGDAFEDSVVFGLLRSDFLVGE